MGGFGPAGVDHRALTYYRYAWAVQDIMAYGERAVLLPEFGVETRREALADLARNADFVKDGLRQAGVPVPEYPGPILRVVPRNQAEVGQLSRMLLRAGIYPPLTRYLRKSGHRPLSVPFWGGREISAVRGIRRNRLEHQPPQGNSKAHSLCGPTPRD
jgi:hypothetical protein